MKQSELIDYLKDLLKTGERKIIAIDGRCASGKTTFAEIIQNNIDCDVVHTDDFFLPPDKRTEERLSTPGGNIDFERLLSEILIPLKNGQDYIYKKFSCKTQSFSKGERITPQNITIVEGSYSCHPELFPYCDLHIFLDIDSATQRERIMSRNKDNAHVFFDKWIPLEEMYFNELYIQNKFEIILSQEG